VTLKKSIGPVFKVALPLLFLTAACGIRPNDPPEAEKAMAVPAGIPQEKESRSVSLPARQRESAERNVKPTGVPSSDLSTGETPRDNGFIKIDWGREAALEEIMAMAKSGKIQRVEWHVMPNIIRALSPDGRIFHIRNENKGVDIRNALMHAGIPIGKDGIDFRHMF